jgi:hypothetical protein
MPPSTSSKWHRSTIPLPVWYLQRAVYVPTVKLWCKLGAMSSQARQLLRGEPWHQLAAACQQGISGGGRRRWLLLRRRQQRHRRHHPRGRGSACGDPQLLRWQQLLLPARVYLHEVRLRRACRALDAREIVEPGIPVGVANCWQATGHCLGVTDALMLVDALSCWCTPPDLVCWSTYRGQGVRTQVLVAVEQFAKSSNG